MQHNVVDGIPVFSASGPGPLTAGLVFGVGRRDESYLRGGITHLVEHLAMASLGRTTVECNASVDLSTTEFTVSGSPDQVVAFLRSVCLALADLPTDRLAVEVDVLRAEGGGAPAIPAVGALLREFYGVEGLGLASTAEPALRALTAADVRAWAGSHFGRQNAALWLVGPEVDGITLPLRDGTPPARAPQYRTSLPVPGWTVLPVDGRVSVGGQVVERPGLGAALDVLRLRVEDELRHRRGIAYSVATDRIAVDATRSFVLLTTDVRAGQEQLAAHVLWRELQRLGDDGPSPAEVDHQRAVAIGCLDDPRSAAVEARGHALAHVTGMPARSMDELRRDWAALTAQQVHESATLLCGTVVLGVPQPLEPPPAGLPLLAPWSAEVVTGEEFARRSSSPAPEGATLVVGPEGASVVLDERRRVTVRWADAAGLVRLSPGELLVVGRDGLNLQVAATDWRGGEEALALIRAAVAHDRQVTSDDAEDDGGEGLLLVHAAAHRVREAVGMSEHDATIVHNEEWTAVLPDGEVSRADRLGALTAVLGRDSVVLVLRRTQPNLEYALLRGGKEVDRQRWGAATGDPWMLAPAVGRRADELAPLYGVAGGPDELVDQAVRALGLPPEVPELLAGRVPESAQHVPGLGARGGFRASMRGEYDGPSPEPEPELEPFSRARPAWYRLLNALGAAVCVLALLVLLAPPRSVDGWSLVVSCVLCAVGLAQCLPRVRKWRPEQGARVEDPADLTPIG